VRRPLTLSFPVRDRVSKAHALPRASRNHEYGGALDFALAQAGQGVVGGFEREGLDLRDDGDARSERKEFLAVQAGEVGDGTDATLLPQDFIRKRGNIAHVDPAADHNAAEVERAQGLGNEFAGGRENDGGIERVGRKGIGIARPKCADFFGEFLSPHITTAGEGVNFSPLEFCHLGDDVTGRAKAVDAQARAVAGLEQRAVANQSGAHERGGLGVRVSGGNGKAKTRIGDGIFGVAAVNGVAGEAGLLTKVFTIRAAKAAFAAGPAKPRDADAITGIETLHAFALDNNGADDFMAGHERELGVGQFAIEEMKISAANRAGANTDEDLAGCGAGGWKLNGPQGLSRLFEHHGAHGEI